MASQQISARVLASRNNGRLGGLKTAQTHSAEFLEARASKAGSTTRDTYGNAYYAHISKATRHKLKSTPKIISEVTNNTIQEPTTSLALIQAATKTLQM